MCEWMKTKLPEKILWTNPGGQRGRVRPKSRLIDGVEKEARKPGCRFGGRMPKIEVAGDICLRRPRPTQGCKVRDDDDDDTQITEHQMASLYTFHFASLF